MPPCSGGIISDPGSAPLPFVLPPPGRVRSACGTRSEFMRLHRTLSHPIRSGRPCPAGPGPSPAHAGGCVHLTPTFDPASMILASVAGAWPRDTPAFGLPCRDGRPVAFRIIPRPNSSFMSVIAGAGPAHHAVFSRYGTGYRAATRPLILAGPSRHSQAFLSLPVRFSASFLPRWADATFGSISIARHGTLPPPRACPDVAVRCPCRYGHAHDPVRFYRYTVTLRRLPMPVQMVQRVALVDIWLYVSDQPLSPDHSTLPPPHTCPANSATRPCRNRHPRVSDSASSSCQCVTASPYLSV